MAYGSYNTLRAGAGINGNIDRFSYNLNYSRINTDGFSAAYDSLGSRGFDKDGCGKTAFRQIWATGFHRL
ncbi:hypothetical protein LWM68_02460 [Niabella sp. W65]|nr:hypothetical protein [Niabella sp. W65]MCH7361742.1 hypothetical protein [Niabella sp. W65]